MVKVWERHRTYGLGPFCIEAIGWTYLCETAKPREYHEASRLTALYGLVRGPFD